MLHYTQVTVKAHKPPVFTWMGAIWFQHVFTLKLLNIWPTSILCTFLTKYSYILPCSA